MRWKDWKLPILRKTQLRCSQRNSEIKVRYIFFFVFISFRKYLVWKLEDKKKKMSWQEKINTMAKRYILKEEEWKYKDKKNKNHKKNNDKRTLSNPRDTHDDRPEHVGKGRPPERRQAAGEEQRCNKGHVEERRKESPGRRRRRRGSGGHKVKRTRTEMVGESMTGGGIASLATESKMNNKKSGTQSHIH